jgi:hypothetical protein
MSAENAIVVSIVWLSLVGLAIAYLFVRSPKRRKPVDELEATDAALRNRIVDLEDKFEHHLKRDAVRSLRDRKEQAEEQESLPFDKAARLSILRRKAAEQKQRGVTHGATG